MSAGLYNHTTRGVGTVLTAAIYNADHQNHITNHHPGMIGGYSDNVAQMQITTNPGGLGSEILSASLADELERIRFCIARIQGTTHWYEAAVTSLATIGGGTPLTLAFGAVPLTLRRTENNTSELTIMTFAAGSGVGNTVTKRIVGSGANAIAEMREYLGSTEIKRFSGTLITHQLATQFNLAAKFGAAGVALWSIEPGGYVDVKMMAAPATPAADHLRLYAKDVGGKARLAYKDEDGTEFLPLPIEFANQAEAEAGTISDKASSPLRVKEFVVANRALVITSINHVGSPGPGETLVNVTLGYSNATGVLTVTRSFAGGGGGGGK